MKIMFLPTYTNSLYCLKSLYIYDFMANIREAQTSILESSSKKIDDWGLNSFPALHPISGVNGLIAVILQCCSHPRAASPGSCKNVDFQFPCRLVNQNLWGQSQWSVSSSLAGHSDVSVVQTSEQRRLDTQPIKMKMNNRYFSVPVKEE